ncbi:hypothetical protein GFS24_22955 [Chitinophaga sp. SYP-B3965]|uniref:hypothetical protein n=1 Tax=Chitinophaga sp. SYP-B3965 TaxID=2663120 RepID=UPI001299AF3E|nr:hypothetical protein [Chitinophaga sp. SYP-B3965]MRG47998.1 hypothetical protein [Chitinophaga sp. SYP-B3965]
MFYQITLFLHSWLRWVVMLLLLATLFTSLYGWLFKKIFTDAHQKLFKLSSMLLGILGLIGIVLFLVASPITTTILYHNIKGITANAGITFFTLRHPLAMFAAIMISEAGQKRANKMLLSAGKFKTWFLFTLIVLLIIAANIPWPFLSFGRPLFRF